MRPKILFRIILPCIALLYYITVGCNNKTNYEIAFADLESIRLNGKAIDSLSLLSGYKQALSKASNDINSGIYINMAKNGFFTINESYISGLSDKDFAKKLIEYNTYFENIAASKREFEETIINVPDTQKTRLINTYDSLFTARAEIE